jgi:hypothetical protein
MPKPTTARGSEGMEQLPGDLPATKRSIAGGTLPPGPRWRRTARWPPVPRRPRIADPLRSFRQAS